MSETSPKIEPIYTLSYTELEILRSYLDENLKKGFIREIKITAGFLILFVPKKDEKLRLCVNYRRLNTITIKDKYSLPNIGELQDYLIGVKWFTKLDLRGIYNLVRIKEDDEWKTIFKTRYKTYEYQIMLFGLINAPAIYQILINNTLAGCLDIYAVAYLDNILIYSRNWKDHRRHVKDILERLLNRQLRCKSEKCEFHKKEVNFLEFMIRTDGIKIDSEKIQKVLDWPVPRNLKDLQRFLGFGNFNRHFISGYSLVILPLTELTKKDILFIWSEFYQKAFDKLKKAFTTIPYLILFTLDRSVKIEIDASDKDMRACLLQQNDERA